MRPSSRMFDGTAQAYESTETKSAYYGTDRAYTPYGAVFRCAIQVRNRVLSDRGPGEAQVGVWMCYAPITDAPLLEAGMVVAVLTGPEAGRRLRIQDPYRPRNRFQQCTCVQFDGVLEEVEA